MKPEVYASLMAKRDALVAQGLSLEAIADAVPQDLSPEEKEALLKEGLLRLVTETVLEEGFKDSDTSLIKLALETFIDCGYSPADLAEKILQHAEASQIPLVAKVLQSMADYEGIEALRHTFLADESSRAISLLEKYGVKTLGDVPPEAQPEVDEIVSRVQMFWPKKER